MTGPYVAGFRNYVKNTLKWESDLHYKMRGNVRPWTYVQNSYMDMTEALRSTMARNPFLKVFVICGYYDMATMVGGIEFSMTHLAYEKQITATSQKSRKNILSGFSGNYWGQQNERHRTL